jgi:plasmid maintenance system antidote protein VapI
MSETIHDRLIQIIKREEMSIAAFERALYVGRNSISTSLRKNASINHDIIQKIAKYFPHYSIEWLILGNHSERTIETNKLAVEVFKVFEAWQEERDKISLHKLH